MKKGNEEMKERIGGRKDKKGKKREKRKEGREETERKN